MLIATILEKDIHKKREKAMVFAVAISTRFANLKRLVARSLTRGIHDRVVRWSVASSGGLTRVINVLVCPTVSPESIVALLFAETNVPALSGT